MDFISEKKTGDLRFFLRKESFVWVSPEEVIFIKSADHYVKTLIAFENNRRWTTRHCTLKEIFLELARDQFIRLNKFYIINKDHVSHIDEPAKIIYLDDGFPIIYEHRISKFMCSIFNSRPGLPNN